jgi:hypothetical protein
MNLAAGLVAVVLTITTQNVKVTLPPPAAHHDINQAAEHSSIVFTQEMGLRRARNFAPRNWGTAHAAGLRQGDCATYWDRAVWRERNSYPTLLTHAPFRAGTRYALTTVLHLRHTSVTVAAVCVHMITRTLQRSRVYSRGMDRLQALLDRLALRYPVVVGGDWNRDWSRRVPMVGYHTARPPHSTGGGARIDYFRWGHDFGERSIRVIGDTRSDHNGVRMRLALRQ